MIQDQVITSRETSSNDITSMASSGQSCIKKTGKVTELIRASIITEVAQEIKNKVPCPKMLATGPYFSQLNPVERISTSAKVKEGTSQRKK